MKGKENFFMGGKILWFLLIFRKKKQINVKVLWRKKGVQSGNFVRLNLREETGNYWFESSEKIAKGNVRKIQLLNGKLLRAFSGNGNYRDSEIVWKL